MKRISIIGLLFFSIMFSYSVIASDQINTGWIGKTAIKGYDTVAYFTQGKPLEGDSSFLFEWMGANWLFSSAENLELFKSNPEKYAPQYGGYCAYAVANNKLAGIDPTQFTVLNDKLYLNYNKKIQDKWLGNRDAFISSANTNWPKVLDK